MTVILEYAGGAYQPLGQASSLDEARDIVEAHLAALDPDRDELPTRAAIWERDERGDHVVIKSIHFNHE